MVLDFLEWALKNTKTNYQMFAHVTSSSLHVMTRVTSPASSARGRRLETRDSSWSDVGLYIYDKAAFKREELKLFFCYSATVSRSAFLTDA